MTFTSFDAWWWPYVFILVAGWLATDSWRFLGVLIGDRMSDDSDAIVLVRSIATALVAAVIAGLVVSPSGELANAPLLLRIGATVIGFAAYLLAGKRMVAGLLAGEAVLVAGLLLF
ncbi:MAG TPA: AzlD domain-containing protein [Rhizobiaceae bacterium]|nr:AzlD domain-containing protein [Rhizobiaceae bacterium]